MSTASEPTDGKPGAAAATASVPGDPVIDSSPPTAATSRWSWLRDRRPLVIAIVAGVVLLGAAAIVAPQLLRDGADPAAAPGTSTTEGVEGQSPAPDASAGDPTNAGEPGAPPGGGQDPAPTTTAEVSVAQSTTLETQALQLINDARDDAGCVALRADNALAAAARAHSVEMASTGTLGHASADGTDPAGRMSKAGYDPSDGWAENVAQGPTTPQAVLDAWWANSSHRANILNCDLVAAGVGAAQTAGGDTFWTLDLGAS